MAGGAVHVVGGAASRQGEPRVIDLEQARLNRANKGADREAQRQRECYLRSHSSVSAFERAMDNDEYARLCRELSGDVGRHASDFLRQVNQVQCWNTALITYLAAMAGTIAASICQHTADLLHRSNVLLAAGNHLGSEGRACLRDDGAKLR